MKPWTYRAPHASASQVPDLKPYTAASGIITYHAADSAKRR